MGRWSERNLEYKSNFREYLKTLVPSGMQKFETDDFSQIESVLTELSDLSQHSTRFHFWNFSFTDVPKYFKRVEMESDDKVLLSFAGNTSHVIALPMSMEVFYFEKMHSHDFIRVGYSAARPEKCPLDDVEPQPISYAAPTRGTFREEVADGWLLIYSIASYWDQGNVEGERWNLANFGEKGLSFKELTDFIDGKFRKFND